MIYETVLPIQLFIIFEKSTFNTWTSRAFTANTTILNCTEKWWYEMAQVISNDILTSYSILLDTSGTAEVRNVHSSTLNNPLLVFTLIYIYTLKLRLILLLLTTSTTKIRSMEMSYKNASWVEREAGEMLGCIFNQKDDTRKLLLPYSQLEHPLKKTYPCEGTNEVFFNMFNNQVVTLHSEVIEL